MPPVAKQDRLDSPTQPSRQEAYKKKKRNLLEADLHFTLQLFGLMCTVDLSGINGSRQSFHFEFSGTTLIGKLTD